MCISEDYLLGKKEKTFKVRESIYLPNWNPTFGVFKIQETINISESSDSLDQDNISEKNQVNSNKGKT